MGNPSDNVAVHEKRALREEFRLKEWRGMLKHSPEEAEKAMKRALGVLLSQKCWDRYDIAQFYAQMKNGVAHPSDFVADDGSICELRRA